MTLHDVLQGIRLRGLVAAWLLTMLVTLGLVLTGPSTAITSLVLGGVAASVVALVRKPGEPGPDETERASNDKLDNDEMDALAELQSELGTGQEGIKNLQGVSVLVVDDDPFARRVLRGELARANATVVAEARTGREAIELSLAHQPDVVIMDLVMPEMDGLQATREIHERAPSIRVVMLTGAGDDEVALLCLHAGAAGYLSKDMELTDLPLAVRRVVDGEAVMPGWLATRLIERYRSTPTGGARERPVDSTLTVRDQEILDLLSTGATAVAIGAALGVSSETVRSNLESVFQKLGVTSRADALRTIDRMHMRKPRSREPHL
ncbi:MAG: response regulator transcription factor, partial [Actinomycetota bacterium]